MNKKILTIIAILILFLTVSTVNASFFDFLDDINPNYKNNVTNDEKTLVVGVNIGFPPFVDKTASGDYAGFDIDLAKEVCKRNNWTFVVQPIINWDSKEVELNSGEIDCIWGAFTINNRENDYTWTEPYFNNTEIFVVKSDSNISSINDLKGKTVEVQVESSGLDALKGQNKSIGESFKIQGVHDINTGFMDLESGACDAILVDSGIANNKLTQKQNSFKILDTPLSYDSYGVGFKKGNTALRDQVQKTLDEMLKDGTVDKIAQNYTQYDIQNHIIRR
ncbi:transporter substrate-binding domain-containing protein [uncultured Methanobrevibacter sp.]|uniref:transporter substrate-binding domain-containing protein n=1 Tax=uncultured Methanobrevibacter sp. TaxID=253161 RepID=UPI0025D409D8|nr:transporter substrate-binding domain-containing protein [uncultured Methanobrevibacter sp.]